MMATYASILAVAILCVAILLWRISAEARIPPRVRLTGALVEFDNIRPGSLQELQSSSPGKNTRFCWTKSK